MADPFKFPSFGLGAFGRIPGNRTRKPADGPALETEGSNLEKIFRVLSKPGDVERQALINLHQGKPVGENVLNILNIKPNESIPKNVVNLFKAEPESVRPPSGSDLVQELRGGASPTSKTGKAAQAIAGIAVDVLNPADPLNWLGIGELKGGAKGLEALGKAPGVIEGLEQGGRAFGTLSLKNAPVIGKYLPELAVHTPKFVDEAAGGALRGLGDVGKALGGGKVVDFFKPQFVKLAGYTNRAKVNATDLFEKMANLATPSKIKDLEKSAIEKIKAGKLGEINPDVSAHWDKMKLTPKQKVWAEVNRLAEMPIAEKSGGAKIPAYMKEFLGKVPTSGDTLDEIKQIQNLRKSPLDILGEKKSKLGIEGQLEGFAPRIGSDSLFKTLDSIGVPREKAERSIKDFTMQQAEAIAKAENILGPLAKTPEAQQAISAQSARIRANFYGKMLGNKAMKENPQLLEKLKLIDPPGATIYETDGMKAFGKEVEGSSREISLWEGLGDILKNQSIAKTKLSDWGGEHAVKWEIPKQFQKMIGDLRKDGAKINMGHMYVTPETAHELQNLVGVLTDTDKMQKMIGGIQGTLMGWTRLFSRMTLLSFPGTVPYGMRNITSNNIQSALAGAWSASGVAKAFKMIPALIKGAGNPERLAQEAEKLGPLGEHLKIMHDSNLFGETFSQDLFQGKRPLQKFEKAIGIDLAGKWNAYAEDFGRIQHYMTRIGQGWTPEAAIADVRKYLYDYAGGLSPQLQGAKAIFPFLSWTRFNLPIMVEHMIKHPAKVEIPYRFKENIENTLGSTSQGKPDERALDEFVKGDFHIRLWQDEKTGKYTYLRLKNTIPIADLEDITGMTKFMDLMTSSLTPYIKTPLENLFNQSLFFRSAGGERSPIENYPGQTGKFLGMDMGRKTINTLRNIRPLSEVNRLIPGERPILGAPEQAIRMSGLSLIPIDMNKSTESARFAYLKQLSNLKMAKKRQEQKGKPSEDIQKLMEQLNEQAYRP